MKRILQIAALAALVVSAASCSKTKAEQMAMAENISIQCNPEVLALVGNSIPVELSVTYPKGYFHPSATMVVTPVLVYEGGQLTGESFIYQGENVKDNYKMVPAAGGTVREKFSYEYVKGCEKSHLELRSVVFYNGARTELPAIKVADGCVTTVMLADLCGACEYKADGYQSVIKQVTEGQIMYDVNSADVKGSQLNSESIRDFKAALDEIQDNSRVKVTGTRIVAYASPEGGEKLNTELSDKRASSARQAWSSIAKGMDAGAPEVKSIGQDWEGFQEAISKSNIEDKDLILRVLSMYSDPAVRESEIRNMSQIYTQISDKVFPELRRARFITETEYQNYTDEELEQMSQRRMYMLDEPSVLRLATNAKDTERKIILYKLAAKEFDSDIARFNLAKVCLDKGQFSLAEAYAGQMKNADDPDVINLKGIVALREGKTAEAVALFKKAGTDAARQNLGLVDLLAGDYKAAAAKYEGAEGVNAALAFILAGDLAKAESALTGDDAMSDYCRAIVAARRSDKASVNKYLDAVKAKDAALAERAARDIEFAAFVN